ncbi:hypothetical protein AB1Y20_017207 [Prymnesium parvum]|uniref:Histone-lysine N-methyltransferase n=1 Tax=Prymnesium parvum TaxID=97485 RepID=A0AB34IAT3_PRYPA
MRRRASRSADVNVCPMCLKVVEFGVICESCACSFCATEECCGRSVNAAFGAASKEWCCLNCFPRQGAPPADDASLPPPAAAIELLAWRRAFRVFVDACAGCDLRLGGAQPALRCEECELGFHASARCTGLSAAKLAAAAGGGWRCATCAAREWGMASPDALLLADVSGGQEPRQIPLVNEVDDERPDFEYVRQVAWRNPRSLKMRASLPAADWRGRCIAAEACSYLPASRTSGGRPVLRSDVSGAAYNSEGCLMFARDTIFECNSSCSCDASCTNRVVGKGVWAPLQVFKTKGRGWGVRSTKALAAGSFICEYTGEMLLDSDADHAGTSYDDSYLFNLDGEEKGQVSKRRRTSHLRNEAAEANDKNPALCVDAGRTGSVARFVNHCCEPNLFVQSVYVEYSRHVHRIALFAARDILAFEELTYDYGYVVGSVEGKSLKCLCGAAGCRGYLF